MEQTRSASPASLETAGIVWHYTSGDALINIIENDELWAFSTAFMNDTEEVIRGTRMFEDLYEKVHDDLPKRAREALDSWWFPRSADEPEAVPKFLFSASALGDNLSMWRSYGQNGAGYAIGLDRREGLSLLGRDNALPAFPSLVSTVGTDVLDNGHPPFNDPNAVFVEFVEWVDAIYDHAQQEDLLRVTFEEARQMWTDPEQARFSDTWRSLIPSLEKQKAIRRIKDLGFRDEREVRLVPSCTPAWKFVHYHSSKFGVAPHVKLTGKVHGGPNWTTTRAKLPIRAIKIGPTAYPTPAVASIKGLLEMNGYENVEVTISQIPYR